MPNLGCWLIGGAAGRLRAVPPHPPPWSTLLEPPVYALHPTSRRMAPCTWGA